MVSVMKGFQENAIMTKYYKLKLHQKNIHQNRPAAESLSKHDENGLLANLIFTPRFTSISQQKTNRHCVFTNLTVFSGAPLCQLPSEKDILVSNIPIHAYWDDIKIIPTLDFASLS